MFNETATTEIYTYGPTRSLHEALPICSCQTRLVGAPAMDVAVDRRCRRKVARGTVAHLSRNCGKSDIAPRQRTAGRRGDAIGGQWNDRAAQLVVTPVQTIADRRCRRHSYPARLAADHRSATCRNPAPCCTHATHGES